jgi:hypothetical protein
MKKSLAFVAVGMAAMTVSAVVAAPARAGGLMIGAVRDDGQDTWVAVAETVSNYNDTFRANDTCVFLAGGQVRVIDIGQHFGVKLLYTLPSAMDSAGGTLCPPGTLTYMSAADVSALPPAGTVTPDDVAAEQPFTNPNADQTHLPTTGNQTVDVLIFLIGFSAITFLFLLFKNALAAAACRWVDRRGARDASAGQRLNGNLISKETARE